MGTSELDFQPGGWVAYRSDQLPGTARVRLEQAPTGRWATVEVHIAGDRITARDLRSLPIGDIEARVNLHYASGAITGELTLTAAAVVLPAGAEKPGPKPDNFYQRIAEIYRQAAVVSTRPAADLATAWNVPLTSVHRWVRVARGRGYLPPTEKGRKA